MGKTAVFEGEYSLSKILDLEEEVLKNSNQRQILRGETEGKSTVWILWLKISHCIYITCFLQSSDNVLQVFFGWLFVFPGEKHSATE